MYGYQDFTVFDDVKCIRHIPLLDHSIKHLKRKDRQTDRHNIYMRYVRDGLKTGRPLYD